MKSGAMTPRRIDNVLWLGGEPAEDPTLDDVEESARLLAGADGHFALVSSPRPGAYVLARDALGVHKLFFALREDGSLDVSTFWIDLVKRGHAPEAVWSVPAGHVMSLDAVHRTLQLRRFSTLRFGEGPFDEDALRYHTAVIRARLASVFRRIAGIARGRPVYVALSGGLDSTGIAVLARALLGEVTAVTFAVDGAEESEDLRYARRVAADLRLPFLTVRASPEEIAASVDDVLVHGQDWRDFNVHCALVNDAIGRALAERHPPGTGPAPLLLTGDTMNELMTDYSPVKYGDTVYYRLPRLDRGRLRRALVAGLDAGDREVGVLARHGVQVIQPYALAADAYTALPDGAVEGDEAKQLLVRAVLGARVPAYVYERPKVRAQCGGQGVSGTLAVLADRGVGARELRARFASLFGLDPSRLAGMLSAGRYRFPTEYPALPVAAAVA